MKKSWFRLYWPCLISRVKIYFWPHQQRREPNTKHYLKTIYLTDQTEKQSPVVMPTACLTLPIPGEHLLNQRCCTYDGKGQEHNLLNFYSQAGQNKGHRLLTVAILITQIWTCPLVMVSVVNLPCPLRLKMLLQSYIEV